MTRSFYLWPLLICFAISLCSQNTKVLICSILEIFFSNTKNIWSMLLAVGRTHLCWASLVEGGGRGIILAYFSQVSWIMPPWARSIKSDHRHTIHYAYLPTLFCPVFQIHCLGYIIYKTELKFLVTRASERIKGHGLGKVISKYRDPITVFMCLWYCASHSLYFPWINLVLLAVWTTCLSAHSSSCESAFSIALSLSWVLFAFSLLSLSEWMCVCANLFYFYN